jgi:acid ceramidase
MEKYAQQIGKKEVIQLSHLLNNQKNISQNKNKFVLPIKFLMQHMSETQTFSNPPNYILNLDLPPSERWISIIKNYKNKLKPLVDFLNKSEQEEIGSTPASIMGSISSMISKVFTPTFIVEELEGIASITAEEGLTFKKLLMLNIGYSLITRCTSGIIEVEGLAPFHIRNMDWEGQELKDLTINVEYQKGGKTIFTSTQWIGNVGLLTGMRNDSWSFSLNYRWTNTSILRTMLRYTCFFQI